MRTGRVDRFHDAVITDRQRADQRDGAAEGGGLDPSSLDEDRKRATLDLPAGDFEQARMMLGDAATDDDDVGIEQVDERGAQRADGDEGAIEQGDAGGVALGGGSRP